MEFSISTFLFKFSILKNQKKGINNHPSFFFTIHLANPMNQWTIFERINTRNYSDRIAPRQSITPSTRFTRMHAHSTTHSKTGYNSYRKRLRILRARDLFHRDSALFNQSSRIILLGHLVSNAIFSRIV